MTTTDDDFLALFRQEADERLETMVEILLAVERGEADADAVNALFREAHTLKGVSSMVGLDGMSALAAEIEDTLSEIRATGGQVSPDLVEPLMQGVDAMRAQAQGRVVAPAEAPTAGPRAETKATGERDVRVSPAKVDRILDIVSETVLHRRRLDHEFRTTESGRQALASLRDELDQGERMLTELKEVAVEMRMLPFGSIAGPLRRATRELARTTGKDAELVLAGAETELDRAILEGLAEPLVHLLRNAISHGIEAPDERERAGKAPVGRVDLRAEQRDGMIAVTLADDGRGVSPEVLARVDDETSLADLLAVPGFSTASEVTQISGRGVGLDAVKRHAESFGGSVTVESAPGQGTEITIMLPLTVALLEVLLFESGPNVFGLPLANVEQVFLADEPFVLAGRMSVDVGGKAIPLTDVAELIGVPGAGGRHGPAVVVAAGGRRFAVACEQVLGDDVFVIKPLAAPLGPLAGYLGTAMLGDGRIALILEPQALARAQSGALPTVDGEVRQLEAPRASKILVVEDSLTVRQLQRSILESAGYTVVTAEDGRAGLAELERDDEICLVITDVEMPRLDGIGLTKAIRADARWATLPIVIVTSLADAADRQRGVDAGADAYVVKQMYEQQALLETVERLIGA